MRRIVVWAMSTLTVLVILFSYNTSRGSSALVAAETRQVTTTSKSSGGGGTASGSAGSSASSAGAAGAAGGSSGQDAAAAAGPSASAPSSSSAGSSSQAKTYAGDAVMTRYGNVQVQITVQDGRISAVEVLQVPMQDRHDEMINSMAVPVYNQEAVSAQSAQIDVVSGATYTWQGYTQSLQSAIDQAHL